MRLRSLARVAIETVDPHDDVWLREAHSVTLADASRSFATPWTWHEYALSARTPDPWSQRRTLLARDAAGNAVAATSIDLPQRDNTIMVWVDLAVAPGMETSAETAALISAVLNIARANGRREVHASAERPVDARVGPNQIPLEHAGFELVLENAHRVLDLPVDATMAADVLVETAPHHRDYRFVAWRDECPEEWVAAYADLRSRILIEAPDGGVGYEAQDFGPDRVRHEEADLRAQQRVSYTTIAVHSDGAVAGHSHLVVPDTDPANAYQWDTLVLSAHRGHRLGLALKARNLSEAEDALAPRSSLHTWNAVENTPMIAVNERLGFRLVEYAGEFRCLL